MANLEYLIDYIENKLDVLLIIVSDHGTVTSHIEAEQTNHGFDKNENSSFVFFKQKNIDEL